MIEVLNETQNLLKYGVTPIYIKSNKNGVMPCIATAFIVLYENIFFLVTAQHATKDLKNGSIILINNEEPIILDSIQFYNDNSNDISVAFISKLWLKEKGITKIRPLIDFNNNTNKHGEKIGSQFLGFPHTKNVLDQRFNKGNRHLSVISIFTRINKFKAETKLKNPICYKWDHENYFNKDFSKNSGFSHSLKSMSGSPLLDVYVSTKNNNDYNVKYILEGIFLEWNYKTREVLFSPVQFIEELCKKAYAKNKEIIDEINLKLKTNYSIDNIDPLTLAKKLS